MSNKNPTKVEQALIKRGFHHYNKGVWVKSTEGMSVAEWLKEREFGIGGSDTGTILGFNTFKTAVELFREKVGLNDAPELKTRHVYWGNEGEDAILNVGQYYDFSIDPPVGKWDMAWVDNLYNETKIRDITKFDYLCINIKFPWLIANIDGLENHDVEHKMATMVSEAKNTQTMVCKRYNDWVNPTYIAQGLTYSKVLQPILLAPGFKIFQKLDGNDVMARIYTLSDFEWLVDDIMNETHEFYENMKKGIDIVKNAKNRRQAVLGLRKIEPGPDDSERYNKFISKEYLENITFKTADLRDLEEFADGETCVGWEGHNNDIPIVMPFNDVKDMESHVAARVKADLEMKKFKAESLLYSNTIKKFMSDHGVSEVKLNGGYVRWKSKFTVNYNL